jgi:hypothetical protein
VTTQLVLAETADLAAVRSWLDTHGTRVEDIARGHSELACLRVAASDGSEAALLDDHVGDVRYVSLCGPQTPLWAAELARRFPCESATALLMALRDDTEPRRWIRTLSKLAVLRPEHAEPLWLSAWSRALAHPHRAVRRAAIRCCYGARWPELLALVERRLAEDAELTGPLTQLRAHLGGAVSSSAAHRP